MCKVIPIILVLGLAGGLAYYFLTKNKIVDPASIDWPTLEDFHREAPWNATSPSTAQRWPNDGRGLSLTILNALDSKWYSYFEAAISDWDAGMGGIDPLTLTTQVVTAETECTPETGYQKVCNGDYGENGWNGINTILTTSSSSLLIEASAARMNEYYLNSGSDALKQYTMCHELGHGWGLPHSDERFVNSLDYTMFPENNLHPDYGQFEFLEALYGNPNGKMVSNVTYVGNLTDDSAVQSQSTSSSGQRKQSDGSVIEGGSGSGTGTGSTGGSVGIPSWVRDAWDSVTEEFVNYGTHTASEDKGWRLLHSRGNLRSHQIDIGQGYTIVVHLLLADGYEDRLLR